MADFRESRLYRTSLGAESSWTGRRETQRLASALERFREHAAAIAARIAFDLPDFTSHDISHIDALWQTADQIVSDDHRLTPTEAFVFGGAALVHDLGLATAAYVDGVEALTSGAQWDDALFQAVSRELGRPAGGDEVEAASAAARRAATEQLLRHLHARQASSLVAAPLQGPEGPIWLLEDADLRLDVGWLIGTIAASHWWDPSALTPAFANRGAHPKDFPPEWTIDPLTLACLLRVADAAHLDGTRARAIAQAIQRPSSASQAHWTFQRLLQPVRRDGDQLMFESARPFARAEADAWWLCLDTLRAADRELRAVDALLADARSDRRFAVRSVAGVDHPGRLAERIHTEAWSPVDARLHVSDIASLVERLGGRQLYGDDARVSLREIVQNAQDAVRARAVFLGGDESLGSVLVSRGSDEDGAWLAVTDDGVGMPLSTLTGSLLDFGVSGWQSGELADRLPGLLSRGFRPTGRFGIGFASVFMGSRRVQVMSRALDAARAETNVLEFLNGSSGRPLVRPADPDEQQPGAGTTVRTWAATIEEQPTSRQPWEKSALDDLGALTAWLCPASETDVRVQRPRTRPRVVRADDWKRLDAVRLLKRIGGVKELELRGRVLRSAPERLTVVYADGVPVGRAALVPAWYSSGELGVLTVGGLRAKQLEHVAGVLLGHAPNLARDNAAPLASKQDLRRWAIEQRDLLCALRLTYDEGVLCASMLLSLGVEPTTLPICRTADGPLSFDELVEWTRSRRHVLLFDADDEAEDVSVNQRESLVPGDDVVVCSGAGFGRPTWFAPASDDGFGYPFPERIEDLVHAAIETAWGAHWAWEEGGPTEIGTADGRAVETVYYTEFERADPNSPEWQEYLDEIEAPPRHVEVIVDWSRAGLPSPTPPPSR